MKQMLLLRALGQVEEDYIVEAAPSGAEVERARRRPRAWLRAGVACLLLCTLLALGLHAYAAGRSESLLDVKTAPPAGLTMTIGAAPDDAEFHIVNQSACAVTYGKASRVERWDGGKWVEVITERRGIFPAGSVTMQPGQEMYGMCGWTLRKLVLSPGSYRYLLVVDVMDLQGGHYPVVLKAAFEIE